MAASGSSGGGNAGGVRAGLAFVELYAKDNQLVRAFDNARQRTLRLAATMTRVGAGVAGVAGTVLGGVGAIFKAVVDRNVDAGRLAARFGDSIENFTRFQYAAEKTGVSAQELGDILENLPERIDDAARGGGEASEVFRRMGIDARSFMELPLTERFAKLADGLQGLNDVQRASILGKLFSDKGQQLGELLGGGSGAFRATLSEADQFGAVATKEQERQSREVATAWFQASTAVQAAVREIGAAFLPQAKQIATFAKVVISAAAAARIWLREHKEAVQAIALTVATAAALGSAAVVVGTAISLIANPVGLTVIAVVALTTAFVTLTETGARTAAAVKGYFAGIAVTAEAAWQGIEAALKGGDIELAGRIVFAGLRVEFERGTVLLTQTWKDFKEFFVGAWKDAIYLAKTAWIDFGESVMDVISGIKIGIANGISGPINAALQPLRDAPGFLGLGPVADTLGKLANVGGDPAQIAADKAARNAAADAEKKRLTDENRDAAAARKAAAAAAVAAANGDLAAAQAELAALVAKAKALPPQTLAGADGGAAGQVRASVAAAVQGVFGGAAGSLTGIFGRGEGGVQTKQLAAQMAIQANTAATAAAVKEFKAPAFA